MFSSGRYASLKISHHRGSVLFAVQDVSPTCGRMVAVLMARDFYHSAADWSQFRFQSAALWCRKIVMWLDGRQMIFEILGAASLRQFARIGF